MQCLCYAAHRVQVQVSTSGCRQQIVLQMHFHTDALSQRIACCWSAGMQQTQYCCRTYTVEAAAATSILGTCW
jgi:hypothetical protein